MLRSPTYLLPLLLLCLPSVAAADWLVGRDGQLVECPACYEVIHNSATICRFCGTAMQP